MSDFAKNLADLMRSVRLTQKKLAAVMGVRQQTVSRWTSGINEPDLQTLLDLCRVLETSPNELLGWDDEAPSPTHPNTR